MGLKIKCWFCNQKYVNDYHLAAAHTKAYHDLLFKIHEKIEFLQNGYLDMSLIGTRKGAIELLESLLEDEK